MKTQFFKSTISEVSSYHGLFWIRQRKSVYLKTGQQKLQKQTQSKREGKDKK